MGSEMCIRDRYHAGSCQYQYSCKIETGFLCGDGARFIHFFARVIQQVRFLDSRNLKQTSTTTATVGAAPSVLRSALDLSS